MFSLSQAIANVEPLAVALRSCRPHLAWAAVFSAFVNVLYLAPTLYMMQVYDRVLPTGGAMTLALVTVVALLALANLSLLDWLRGRVLLRAALRLDRLLSNQILSRGLDSRVRVSNGCLTREFDRFRQAVSGAGALALLDAPWIPIYLVCCFLLHPWIGLTTLSGGLVLLGLALLNEREGRLRIRSAHDATSAAYQAQENTAFQAEVVRALGMRRASIIRQATQRRSAVCQSADAQFISGRYNGAIKFVRLVLQSSALGLAALLAVRGELSAGSIIASSVLLSRAVAPIELLVGSWPQLVSARTSLKLLSELFEQTADQQRNRTSLPAPKGLVSCEAATLRFDGTERPQLRQVSFALEPGSILGVIGPSGSGKTTLARALAGAHALTSGVIRLGGAAYDARDPDELAQYIGYLPQSPTLFQGSVRDNISRFSSSTGALAHEIDRGVVRAAQEAGAHDMVLRLPRGYETELGPFGAGLSAGQAQRVALARALYGSPVLLVLDEPNSNLDQEGEVALLNAVRTASRRGAAVVVVAHRPGILAHAHSLLLMQDGACKLFGPREEVLSSLAKSRTPSTEAA